MKRHLIVLVILSFLLFSCQNQELPLPTKEDVANKVPSENLSVDERLEPIQQGPGVDEEYLMLKAQLGQAAQSGGINPDAYKEIDEKIRTLEDAGLEGGKASELRMMLDSLEVGGKSQAAPQQNKELIIFPGWNTTKAVTWHYRDGTWIPTKTPPDCPKQFTIEAPLDLNLATSILYPGQVRGGDFKPHGGFRTDKTNGKVEVRSPIEGYVWRVAKFTDDFGLHYMFDIQHPCGMMVRLGHLGEVPPRMEGIFEGFPVRDYRDSRTELVEPFFVGQGEVIATDVQQGSGFDLGLYDLRMENEASKDPAFRKAHSDEPEQAYHALCWFDYLSAEQEKRVRGLPAADGISGKKSDYC